jgi:hypothetical protein
MKRWAALLLVIGSGCVVHDQVPIKTQVRTFPEGATVEFNGHPVGRAPAAVILPQDTNGRLTERAVVRAVPNTAQTTLVAQSRVFEPGTRRDRVPDYVMIDMTLPDTNTPVAQLAAAPAQVERASTNSRPARPKPTDRGKPTQPVGMDRWNPGIY